jgi:hypothetical protein
MYLADSIVTTDSGNVRVAAVKPASRGEGVIVRLCAAVVPEEPVLVAAHHFRIDEAFLCDARERDLKPLLVEDAVVRLVMKGTVETIRLLPS